MSRERLTLVLLAVLLGPGCVSTYAPVSPVAPLLERKGDLVVGGSVRAAQPQHGGTAYMGAAPTQASRVYAAGSITRIVGDDGEDGGKRRLRQRNHTDQFELGAGWGMARLKPESTNKMLAEVLAGVGFGRTEAAQCEIGIATGDCHLWIDSSSRFTKGFVQGHVARRWQPINGTLGAGLKGTLLRYDIEELFGRKAERVAWVTTMEPFMVSRIGFDWGMLNVGVHLPFVVHSTQIENNGIADSFALQPGLPRITLGIQANLAELWR